uniref:Uncharacterized protein n=1 Tax=candidate division CPR3 bacterium TaxID=2268181 RepID=A0A7C5UUH6_UNCC3
MKGTETHNREGQLDLSDIKALLTQQKEQGGQVPDSGELQFFLNYCTLFMGGLRENPNLGWRTKATAEALVLEAVKQCRQLYLDEVRRTYPKILGVMGLIICSLSTVAFLSMHLPLVKQIAIIAAFNLLAALLVELPIAIKLAEAINNKKIWREFGIPLIDSIRKTLFLRPPSRRR